MPTYRYTVHVDAPLEIVWQEAAERFGEVHRWAPGLSASRLETPGGPQEGAKRVCTPHRPLLGMDPIVEEVTCWQPPDRLGYRLLDPPFPVAAMGSTWSLDRQGDGTRLAVDLELTMRGGRWLAPVAALAWRWRLKGLVEDGVDAFRSHVEAAGVAPRAAVIP